LVIRTRVAKLAIDLKLDNDTKDQLETQLLEMEHRTYLWLYLAIESIHQTYRNSLRPEEVLIKSLPSSVEDAYEKILSRIDHEQRGNVKKILQIVVGTRRPLHIEEMAIALGIATSSHPKSLHHTKLDPSRLENNIRHWCGLFVFINHARIYLIHQTAKEFLVAESGCTTFPSGWKKCFNPRRIEREMTHICLEFLSFDDVSATAQSLIPQFLIYQRPDDVLEKDNHIQSLLLYSAEHWPSHLRGAYIPHDDSAVFRILGFYQVNSRLYNVWFPVFWQATRPYDNLPEMSPIRLGGLLGHENILELTLQRKEDYDINELDSDGRTALFWASEYGHEKVVQILLERGADINARGRGYSNALYTASEGGHEKVVQMLLERGADVNTQGGEYGNALQAASYGGHEKVVQILLERGADVNTQGERYGNALQAASVRGHEKVVQILLERGADVNSQGGWYGNALQAASASGHEKVVRMLLERGACCAQRQVLVM
jgi:Ankyrin repeats (3 copies)/Ankyrin repeats (many copies)